MSQLFKLALLQQTVCEQPLDSSKPTSLVSMLLDSYADLVTSAAEYCFFQQSAQGAQVAHSSFLAMHTNAGTYAPPPAASPERKRRADDMDCDDMDVEGGEEGFKRSRDNC